MSDELPPHPWVMKCGCTAQAVQTMPDGTKRPVCFPCHGIVPGADELADVAPSLDGRRSRCAYYKPALGRCPTTRHSRRGDIPGDYPGETDSSWKLPFFRHQPEKPFDEHFCGCWGWD